MSEAGGLTGDNWDEDLAAFVARPTIANYLLLRRLHPGREPTGWWFSGIDPLFAMSEDLERWEIPVADVAAAMDADHSAIERVALRLLHLLADREAKWADNETQLVRRGATVPDQLVDYLIVILLEGMSEYDEPASIGALNFLIRERLGGPDKAMHAAYLKRTKKQAVVSMIASARRIPDFAEPTLRQVAAALGMNVSSASRLFQPGELERLVSVEMERSSSEGPLIDPDEVTESEHFRALHRNIRAQQP